jgi:hypothetical protein
VPALVGGLLWWRTDYLFMVSGFLSEAGLFHWTFSFAIVFLGLWTLAKGIRSL